jgi:hypothetical protein
VASRAKLSRPRPESDAAGSFAAASRKPSISDLVPDFGVRTGAGQNSHNAGRGAMICLWKSFQIPVKPENLRSLGAMLPSLELNDGAVGDETKNQCRRTRGMPRKVSRAIMVGKPPHRRPRPCLRPNLAYKDYPGLPPGTSHANSSRRPKTCAGRAVIWRTPSPILWGPELEC